MPDALTGALRHSYTVADLWALAHRAAAGGGPDRVETAYSGIAEALYAADTPPSAADLVNAGRAALTPEAPLPTAPGPAGDMLDTIAEPEWQIVESQALRQIWPTLTAIQRRCLRALADVGDHCRAAAALGMAVRHFDLHVHNARRHIFALWYEGETPPPVDDRARTRRLGAPSTARARHATALRMGSTPPQWSAS